MNFPLSQGHYLFYGLFTTGLLSIFVILWYYGDDAIDMIENESVFRETWKMKCWRTFLYFQIEVIWYDEAKMIVQTLGIWSSDPLWISKWES